MSKDNAVFLSSPEGGESIDPLTDLLPERQAPCRGRGGVWGLPARLQ